MKASVMDVSGSIVIGLLAAADVGDGFRLQPILNLRVGLVQTISDPRHRVVGVKLRLGRYRIGVVERADGDADARARDIAVGQRRAAKGAEAALGDGGAG